VYFRYVTCAIRDLGIERSLTIEGFVMRSRGLVQNAARGFTIVELMVVILIAAILAAMAAPSFLDFIARQQIRSAAYELAQTLQTARSKVLHIPQQVIIGTAQKQARFLPRMSLGHRRLGIRLKLRVLVFISLKQAVV
jgi:type II secretion system protein H